MIQLRKITHPQALIKKTVRMAMRTFEPRDRQCADTNVPESGTNVPVEPSSPGAACNICCGLLPDVDAGERLGVFERRRPGLTPGIFQWLGGAIPVASQYLCELKDGCKARTCIAAVLASAIRPSLARAAASKL